MTLTIPKNACFVFDLDDTLYKEIDFLASAYRRIATALLPETGHDIYAEMLSLYQNRKSTFDVIKEKYGVTMPVKEMVEIYRYHLPEIALAPGAEEMLRSLQQQGIPMGLLTDGRSISQRNKLKALHIEQFFRMIIISEEFGSEKPTPANYTTFSDQFPGCAFYYVADNVNKDFITPNQLGWTTIGLKDDGRNIHKAKADLTPAHFPNYTVDSLADLQLVVG
jgi:putative hydrolase of the HAD superfamily